MKLIDDLKRSDVVLPSDKDKTVYIVLAILLGTYGIHNFYAGNADKAKAQLIAGTVGLCFCGIGPIVSCVTAIMDILVISKK